jgi:hypothetical protein
VLVPTVVVINGRGLDPRSPTGRVLLADLYGWEVDPGFLFWWAGQRRSLEIGSDQGMVIQSSDSERQLHGARGRG